MVKTLLNFIKITIFSCGEIKIDVPIDKILRYPLLAKTTKEELKYGREAFVLIIAVSFIVTLIALLLKISNGNKILVVYTAFFIIVISAMSLNKSCNKDKKRKAKIKCYI